MKEGTLARKQWNIEQIKMRTGRKSRVLRAEFILLRDLAKAVSWIYFLSPMVKFSFDPDLHGS